MMLFLQDKNNVPSTHMLTYENVEEKSGVVVRNQKAIVTLKFV